MGQHPLVLPRLDELSVVERRHDEIEGGSYLELLWKRVFRCSLGGSQPTLRTMHSVHPAALISILLAHVFLVVPYTAPPVLFPIRSEDWFHFCLRNIASRWLSSSWIISMAPDCKMTNELRIAAVVCPFHHDLPTQLFELRIRRRCRERNWARSASVENASPRAFFSVHRAT